jgi:hypothetical protein
MKRLIFAFICLLFAVPCTAKIIIVDDDGPADFNNIQAAIDDSNDGDFIYVFPGTYTGLGNYDIDFLGKAVTVQSVIPTDPYIVAETIIDCNGSVAEPHRGFYFHSGEDSNSVLNGLTIRNGYGDNRQIYSNVRSVGGGIFCEESRPKIVNCRIIGNEAGNYGGGIFCFESSPVIENCTIRDNNASRIGGGGLCFLDACRPMIKDCIISGNRAITVGDYSGRGGGIHCDIGRHSVATLERCIIENNSAENGGGLWLDNECDMVIDNCKIVSNTADYRGGGIQSAWSDILISNSIVNGNTAVSIGGGMWIWEGNPTIANSTFTGNSAGSGGAIFGDYYSNTTIRNSIIWNNTAENGHEVCLSKAASGPASMTVSYSDVQGGSSEIVLGPGCVLNWEIGNINTDPCFADPCNGDYHLQSVAGRWDPNNQNWVVDANTSLCIDAGNPGCPLGDEPNDANNIRINMGAYGGTAEASKSPANWRSIADLTNDWLVDINDLGVFVKYWLDTGQCIPSDLNRNQSVNFVDYAVFALQWPGALAAEPRIEYEITPCNIGGSSAAEQSRETRFTVTVQGRYILFEDMMVANCCPDELWLEITVEDNLITIYENEYTPMGCWCICDYPVTATLGPFEPGTYTLEVYEDWGGFIGSTIVYIE